MRDDMAKHGNPTEWLGPDEDVPLERVRDIQVYFEGTWTPVKDAFDAYLSGRAAEYAAAAESWPNCREIVVAAINSHGLAGARGIAVPRREAHTAHALATSNRG